MLIENNYRGHTISLASNTQFSVPKNLYIIGGKQIFQAFEPYLDEVIVTHIHARVEGDTYFPEEFDLSIFETVSSKSYTKDEKNPYDFTIQYRKRKEV